MALNANTSLVMLTNAVDNPRCKEATNPLHVICKTLAAAGLLTMTEGAAAPSGGIENDLYFQYDSGLAAGTAPAGNAKMYRNNGAAWVIMTPALLAAYLSTLNVSAGTSAPANAPVGSWWYDTANATLKVLYWNGVSKQYASVGSTLFRGMVKSATVTNPPGAPSAGDQYIVPTGATGAWSTHVGEIAQWTGSAWFYAVPTTGSTVIVDDSAKVWYFNGGWKVAEGGTAPGEVPKGLPARVLNFTASGTYEPTNSDVRAIKVSVIGAGGGGGNADGQGAGTVAQGFSGGAGAWTETTIIIADPDTYSAALTVGAKGVGGAASAGALDGTDGGDSVFNDTGGGGSTLTTAGGGKGGEGTVGSASRSLLPGGAGGLPTGNHDYGHYGERATSSYWNGGTLYALSDPGGSEWGSRPVSINLQVTQDAVIGYCSGGAGGFMNNTSTNGAGGDGGAGLIIIEEYE